MDDVNWNGLGDEMELYSVTRMTTTDFFLSFFLGEESPGGVVVNVLD